MSASTARRRGSLCGCIAAGFLALPLLAGCATPPANPADRAVFEQNNDPLEPLNRKTFAVNEFLDRSLFRPIARAYVTIIPDDGRKAIHNALQNMNEPIVILNDTLQGRFKSAGISFARLALNTTAGIGGLFDVASRSRIKQQSGDFGQTLYVWGVPSGPYLVLPLFGPSNPRDAVGMALDSYIDPLTFLANTKGMQEAEIPRLVVAGIDERAQNLDVLDDLRKNSLDFYARLRSLAQQHRRAVLNEGKTPAPGNFYDIPAGSGLEKPRGTGPASLPPPSFYDIPAASPAPSAKPHSAGS